MAVAARSCGSSIRCYHNSLGCCYLYRMAYWRTARQRRLAAELGCSGIAFPTCE